MMNNNITHSKYKYLFDIFQTKAFRQGISFGLVSSAMTVLGISFGVWSSGQDIQAIIASIIGLSISNSLADSFSIYMSDSASGLSNGAIYSALVTGFIEFTFPFIFLIPFLTMTLKNAVIINTIIGIIIVATTGIYVSKINNVSDKKLTENVIMYIAITILIIFLTCSAGKIVKQIIKK